MLYLFLTSGLFLGWSLGANDAANVFGSAVGSRMVSFRTAAWVSALFIIIGAVFSGSGTTETLGKLGAVDALAGAFTAALAAGITVTWMTQMKMPVSTSQAIIGAIVGWNLFSGNPTDMTSLTKIVLTWVLCPVLAAIFAAAMYLGFRYAFNRINIHLIYMDTLTRNFLIIAGAFGSFALGANNIANVVGVFVPAVHFPDVVLLPGFVFSGTQQLFLLGSLAIAVGVFTYSRRVMETVGNNLMKLSPETALIVVMAHSIVLFIFSSRELEALLLGMGLPSLPLVPVSSSQAIVGAILGIGMIKGIRNIRFGTLGEIASSWVTTPAIAGIITFIALFFMQNIFGLTVHQ